MLNTATLKIEEEKEKLLEEIKDDKQRKLLEKQYDEICCHLCESAELDGDFSKRILIENKTLKKCIEYINKKARDYAVGGCAMIDDLTVFGWCADYYLEDEPKEEPKKTVEKATKAETKAPTKKSTEKPKKQNTKKSEPKQKSKDIEAFKEKYQQTSIFDLWDE